MTKFLSYKISFFNFLLSVLIIILHSNCKNTLGWENDGQTWSNIIEIFVDYACCLGHLAVPTFFIISAFLFYRNVNSIGDVLNKIRKRIKTLLMPYILWNTLFVLLFFIILNSPLSTYLNMPNKLDNIYNVCKAIINSELTPLWFVKDLIIFVCISPILYIISKKDVILLSLWVMSIINIYIFDEYINYFNPLYWLPSYLTGVLFTKNRFTSFFITEDLHIPYKITYVIVFTILLIGAAQLHFMFLYRLFAPLIVWRLSNILLSTDIIKVKSYWKYSFFIYCTHFFIINIIQKLMFLMMGCSNLSYMFIYILTPCIVLLICILMARFMEHKMHKCYIVLTGNR